MKQQYKNDFITYCKDLKKITCDFIDDNFLQTQNILSFSEVIDEFFEQNPTNIFLLKCVDLCIIAHNNIEYNPIHAHVGTYLINRYQLTCNVFDVIGDGTTSAVFVAENLARMYGDASMICSAAILIFNNNIHQNIAPPSSGDYLYSSHLKIQFLPFSNFDHDKV